MTTFHPYEDETIEFKRKLINAEGQTGFFAVAEKKH